jgi:6-phosphogluconolactonase
MRVTSIALTLLSGCLGTFAMPIDIVAADPPLLRVYIGTYTGEKSEGIYCVELDSATGKPVGEPRVVARTKNPSFLAIHPSRKYLYAVSEIADLNGKKTGGVSAFAIDAKTGDLQELNQQPSGGAGPCHLVTDREGRCVLVANYGGGSVASLPIEADGRLGEPATVIQHEGKSVNPRRQEAPHAHSINVDAENRFAVAADLGLDKVLVYRLDSQSGKLQPHDPPSTSVAPGSGPRHFAFHPSGRYAFVINEMLSTLTSFQWDAEQGTLTEVHTVPTLPAGISENNSTAEVQVHPSGAFVYGSNRGHDSIAAFRFDEETGKLQPIGHRATLGKTPRNFGIDPSGRWLLAANQQSDTICVFLIDSKSGKLSPTGVTIEVPSPVCVKFVSMEEKAATEQ